MKFDVNDIGNYFIVMLGAIAGGVSWVIGGMDNLIVTFIIFMTIDIITGMIAGAVNEGVKSYKIWQGLAKKIVFLLMLVVANLIDIVVGASGVIRGAFLSYAIGAEGWSILENADKVAPGLFPDWLKKVFVGLQEKVSEIDIPLLSKTDETK